jgi:hypothetical protein
MMKVVSLGIAMASLDLLRVLHHPPAFPRGRD